MSTQQQFFYDNAGYSYNPSTQTPEQGRTECAQALADAETLATAHGYSFEWCIDPEITAADWSDTEDHEQWCCVMRNEFGKVVGSIGGVDFGPNGKPWGDDYRRVVEAELAIEYMEHTSC